MIECSGPKYIIYHYLREYFYVIKLNDLFSIRKIYLNNFINCHKFPFYENTFEIIQSIC